MKLPKDHKHRLARLQAASAHQAAFGLSANIPIKKKKKKKHKLGKHHQLEKSHSVSSALKIGEHTMKVERVIPPPEDPMTAFDPKRAIYGQIEDLLDLLETAKASYRELPDGENAMSLTSILREARGLVGDFVSLGDEDRKQILDEMHSSVIQPFFRRVVGNLISEYDSLRRQLVMALGESHVGVVDREIKNSLKNYGPAFQAEYEQAMIKLADQLGVDQQAQPLLDRIDIALKKQSS